jgi:hypothetical protein
VSFNKVIFYNCWHNGDIHVSRSLVKKTIDIIQSKIGIIDFEYCHKNDACLISDIGIKTIKTDIQYCNTIIHSGVTIKNKKLYFNTWYGISNFAMIGQYGLTFKCLAKVFENNLKSIGINYSFDDDVLDVFPSIDFSKFAISGVDNFVKGKDNLILVSDEGVGSAQGNYFQLSDVVKGLCSKFPNHTFILTRPGASEKIGPNVFRSSPDIIKKVGNDLNETAYLSTFCKLIIGRCTGAYTFAMNKQNMYSRNVTMISFSDLDRSGTENFWLGYEGPKYTANVINKKIHSPVEATNIIRGLIC